MISDNLELIILHNLVNQDYYAWQLLLKLREDTQLEIKEVTIYAILKRLEKNELLESYYSTDRKKFYKINSKGINYYQTLMHNWQQQNKIIKKLLGDHD